MVKKFDENQRFHVFDLKTCQDDKPTTNETCKRAYSFDTYQEAVKYTHEHLGIWKILDSERKIPIFKPNIRIVKGKK